MSAMSFSRSIGFETSGHAAQIYSGGHYIAGKMLINIK